MYFPLEVWLDCLDWAQLLQRSRFRLVAPFFRDLELVLPDHVNTFCSVVCKAINTRKLEHVQWAWSLASPMRWRYDYKDKLLRQAIVCQDLTIFFHIQALLDCDFDNRRMKLALRQNNYSFMSAIVRDVRQRELVVGWGAWIAYCCKYNFAESRQAIIDVLGDAHTRTCMNAFSRLTHLHRWKGSAEGLLWVLQHCDRVSDPYLILRRYVVNADIVHHLLTNYTFTAECHEEILHEAARRWNWDLVQWYQKNHPAIYQRKLSFVKKQCVRQRRDASRAVYYH